MVIMRREGLLMPTLIRWTLYLAELIKLPVSVTHALFLAYESRRVRRKPVKRELRHAFRARGRNMLA